MIWFIYLLLNVFVFILIGNATRLLLLIYNIISKVTWMNKCKTFLITHPFSSCCPSGFPRHKSPQPQILFTSDRRWNSGENGQQHSESRVTTDTRTNAVAQSTCHMAQGEFKALVRSDLLYRVSRCHRSTYCLWRVCLPE